MDRLAKLKGQAREMREINVEGRRHIVRPSTRAGSIFPDPNFKGTGCGLVAILKDGEAFKAFQTQWINKKL